MGIFRRVAAVAALITVTACAEVPPLPPVDQTNLTEIKWLDQNWTAKKRRWFHHVTQGTATFMMPYDWFVNLEQPDTTFFSAAPLLTEPAFLTRFGFVMSPQGPDNPDGLPVGFARLKYTDPVSDEPKDTLGLTCAACHTTQFNYDGTAIGVDGGPATVNLVAFNSYLTAAILKTFESRARFHRFGMRLYGQGNFTPAKKAELEKQMRAFIGEGLILQLLSRRAKDDVEEGFGRLDALNRIGNQVFSIDFLNDGETRGYAKDNYASITAPVKLPQIWTTPWFDWVQYDASILQPMVRNAGEALGVGAPVNTVDPGGKLFKSAVPLDNLFAIEESLSGGYAHQPVEAKKFGGLRPPAWPEDILGPIDRGRAARGKALYDELCASCHLAPMDSAGFWADKNWTTVADMGWPKYPYANKLKLLELRQIDIDDLGTDPGEANVVLKRTVHIPPYMRKALEPVLKQYGQNTQQPLFAVALAGVVGGVADYWYDANGITGQKRAEMNGYRPNELNPVYKYKARPLDGIWAAPPYLHNSSTPTMMALLSPMEERPTKVCYGRRTYDPVNMGLVHTPGRGMTCLDVTQPGDLNTGHEFADKPKGNGVIGRGLSKEERFDLIEYLKTL